MIVPDTDYAQYGLVRTAASQVALTQAEILKFTAEFAHTESVSNRREDFHRLFGYAFPLLRIEVLKRPHVVQTIGQLDEHDANIVNHRQQHLAHIFSLLFFTRNIAYLRDLRKAVDEVGYLFSEVLPNGIKVNQRVFYNVVQ